MSKSPWFAVTFRFLAILAVGLPLAACNDDPSTDPNTDAYFANNSLSNDTGATSESMVEITPTTVAIASIGDEVRFSAFGGEAPYRWDLADTSLGEIQGDGDQVIYKVLQIGNNNIILYDNLGHSALASIIATSGGGFALVADQSTLLADNDETVVIVSGGMEPYTWNVGDPFFGKIITAPDPYAATQVYQRLSQGDNAIQVTDSLGNTASIVIKQPAVQ